MGLDVLLIILSGSFLNIIGCWPHEAQGLGIKVRLGIKVSTVADSVHKLRHAFSSSDFLPGGPGFRSWYVLQHFHSNKQ